MNAQFEKRLDEYWSKHGGKTEPTPAARKVTGGIELPGLPAISAEVEGQVKMFREEGARPEASLVTRSRMATASLKALGLHDLFSAGLKAGK